MRQEISQWIFRFAMGIVPIAAAVILTGFARPSTLVDNIVSAGELIVVTRNGPSTYYEDAHGPAGFEYDLARMFADRLGVNLRIINTDNVNTILSMVMRREAHLAAGLNITGERMQKVRFGPAYHEITQQLVYHNGVKPPRAVENLAGEVVSVSSHAEQIKRLTEEYPGVDWRENAATGTDALLASVSRREIPYVVVDSNEVEINQHYYPELRVAFDLTEPEPLAWAFSKGRDSSLIEAAQEFFAEIEDNGQLDQLRERYYGHVREFDYVGVRRFLRHVDQRLPLYLQSFRAAAADLEHDWRLLAAIGYQESHWNPEAISPTGVRGIMMLTNRTASELGIEDRIDPDNSIQGGARYLRQIMRNLAHDIPEPDRTWFALAAYNVGLGHLEDARAITRRRGADPDKWLAVKESLPLLMQKTWYQDTRYGYARGVEAVSYVQNIRSYYNILIWHTTPRGSAPGSQITVSSQSPLTAQTYIPSPVL